VIFQSNNGTSLNEEEVIELMVSLHAFDANTEKKWIGFYNSLSSSDLQYD
tara:strand:+ start:108 stop:257 length:150 start_codon:yes stop_codon:yes gene_type:complete